MVTVVPILAPMIIGTANSTERDPDPTRATIVEVDTDDDCTRTVARTPTNSPAIGFETRSNKESVKSAPNAFIPDSSPFTPTRNR